MTVNLHAVNTFGKGDIGRISGHTAIKTDQRTAEAGMVVALHEVKAGSNGWFEKK
jgi:hypothetical protein